MRKLLTLFVSNEVVRDRLFLTTLVVTAVIPAGLLAYSLLYTYPAFSTLMAEATSNDAVRTARHLGSVILNQNPELKKGAFDAQLLGGMRRFQDDFALMKWKVFSRTGEIVLSSNPYDIGRVNRKDYFQNIVAKGNVHTQVVKKDTVSLEDQKVSTDVMETYVPLMEDDLFVGAVEVYYDITARQERLASLIFRSLLVDSTLAIALLVAIVVILNKRNSAMRERERIERERLQTERLRGVLEMAGAACHELNQPAQGLAGCIGVLERKVRNDDPVFKFVEMAREEVKRIGVLTAKITAITKYKTREYLKGVYIVDIDEASSPDDSSTKARD